MRQGSGVASNYNPRSLAENGGNLNGQFSGKLIAKDGSEFATMNRRAIPPNSVVQFCNANADCSNDSNWSKPAIAADGGYYVDPRTGEQRLADLTPALKKELGCGDLCRVNYRVITEPPPTAARDYQQHYRNYADNRLIVDNLRSYASPPSLTIADVPLNIDTTNIDWSQYQSPPLDLSSNMPTFVRDTDWTATTDWDSYVRSWAPEQDLSYDIPAPPRVFTPPANYDDYDTSAFPAIVDTGAPPPAIDWSLYEDAYVPPYDPGASYAADEDGPAQPSRIISDATRDTPLETPSMFDVDGSGDWADRFRTPEDDAKYPASLDTTSDIPPQDDPSFPQRDLAKEEADRIVAQNVRDEYERAAQPESAEERSVRLDAEKAREQFEKAATPETPEEQFARLAAQKEKEAPVSQSSVPDEMMRDAEAARRSAAESEKVAETLRAEAAAKTAEADRIEDLRNNSDNPGAVEELIADENKARAEAEELNRRAKELDEMAQTAREREKELSSRATKLLETPADILDREEGDLIRERAERAEISRLEKIADSARRVARDWLWGDEGPLPPTPVMPPAPEPTEKTKAVEPAPMPPPVDPPRYVEDRTRTQRPLPPLVRAGARAKTLWDWYRETNTPFRSFRERSVLYAHYGLLNPGEVYRGTKRQNQRLLQYLQTL